MAEKKPKPIFPGSKDLGIHVKNAYGSKLGRGSQIRKYQNYVSTKSGFAVQLPVKSKIWDVGGKSAENENCVLVEFVETVGLFKEGDQMLVSGLNFVTPIDFSTLYAEKEATFTIGTATKSQGVKIAFGPGLAYSSGQKPSIHNGSLDPTQYVDYSNGRDENATSPTGTDDNGAEAAGVDSVDVGSIAKAAAFSTFFSMPGLFDTAESQALTGQRSLMNDQPLMPFIQQLSAACLRQFMSTPSGDFFAFYPDYFGGLGKTAYWLIDDVEVISGSIELSDDNLATHVYVVGDTFYEPSGMTTGSATVDNLDQIHTSGVVTVFNAFMADFLNGKDVPKNESADKLNVNKKAYPTLANYKDAIAFLEKYGARPYYEEQATVRAPIYEAFLAYQKFCLKWSEQFKTQFEFTFMPELFPGGIVAFPEHGLQCYVSSVTHNCSYENGFTTSAELMAPSAYKGADGNALDPDKAWVHAGMIRSWPTTDAVGKFEGATDTDPANKVTPAGTPITSSNLPGETANGG